MSSDQGIGGTPLVITVAADPAGLTTVEVVGFEANSTIPAGIERLTVCRGPRRVAGRARPPGDRA